MIDFPTFYGALNSTGGEVGREPYPWQVELAMRLAEGVPPAAVTVPTGCGKTATIDALLFALCAQADRRPCQRTIGVRTVWAIDRRILVDEVHEHARRLVERLELARADTDDVLHDAAQRLAWLTRGQGPPLATARWRGQVRIEPRAHHPLQPQLITSTAGQIGSRLLFRGYGVGERSLALEAALAAVDCTICLDEAHLVQPLRRTIKAVRALRAEQEPQGSFGPLTLITLTATPPESLPSEAVLTLGPADERVLSQRLDAEKTAVLVLPPGDGYREQTTVLLDAVMQHLAEGASRLACVVNSVGQATELARAAAARFGEDVDRALLIGPQRSHDRAEVLRRHRGAIFERDSPPRPVLVIATQTIEVGLDADFDALVTQSASATAIAQRFGRLNRAGLGNGRATIVRHRGSPLYERDEEACWAWLDRKRGPFGTVDMSPRAIAADGGPPPDAEVPFTPALTPATVELLRQTAPRPAPMADPPIDCFLAGVDSAPADDVLVCWRRDLRLDLLDEDGRAYRQALLTLAPPQREELVPLSLRRFHALLAARFTDSSRHIALARGALQDADVQGGGDVQAAGWAEIGLLETAPMHFVVLRGGEFCEVGLTTAARPRDVRPGDIVVLGTGTGGYADGALAPSSAADVEDVGNQVAAAAIGTRRAALRLSREMLSGSADQALQRAARLADAAVAPEGEDLRLLLAALGSDSELKRVGRADLRRVAGASESPMAEIWGEFDEPDSYDTTEQLGVGVVFDDEHEPSIDAFVLVLTPEGEARPDLLRQVSIRPPQLEAHELDVAERAASFVAGWAGEPLTAAICLAARAHDHGKADDRIQAFYRGGILNPGQELLAKSLFGTEDQRMARVAQGRAGLPRGLRHEIASVAILVDHLERARPHDGWSFDEDLALHLVATHHGLGRPWPLLPGGGAAAREFAVASAGVEGIARGDGLDGWKDGEWLRRFVAINERYGAWGTACLEAVLILADRTVSAEGH